MLIPTYANSFKRDAKLAAKRNKDLLKLRNLIGMIINEIPLPRKFQNHGLHGAYEGKTECHIEPDWLLIYRTDHDAQEVVFDRTGTHSDLFGK
jgi:mRNA interferase YafQ